MAIKREKGGKREKGRREVRAETSKALESE